MFTSTAPGGVLKGMSWYVGMGHHEWYLEHASHEVAVAQAHRLLVARSEAKSQAPIVAATPQLGANQMGQREPSYLLQPAQYTPSLVHHRPYQRDFQTVEVSDAMHFRFVQYLTGACTVTLRASRAHCMYSAHRSEEVILLPPDENALKRRIFVKGPKIHPQEHVTCPGSFQAHKH